jgi:hypothetical protein
MDKRRTVLFVDDDMTGAVKDAEARAARGGVSRDDR